MGVNFGTVNIATSGSGGVCLIGSTVQNAYIRIGTSLNPPVPVSTFDIMAHEMGHAFLFQFLAEPSNALTNLSLDEGIADIIGSYIEDFIKPEGTDWIAGSDIPDYAASLGRGQTIRVCETDMQNAGQHQRGRVISHWFYAISTGIPEDGIPAIGIQAAMDLLIEALNNLNNFEAGFDEMRIETLLAAEMIYGVCSDEYRAIANAWDRVCVKSASENYNIPPLSTVSISNACPEISINLNSLHTETIPQGVQIIWSTDNDASDGVDPQINPVVTSSGTYFAYYYNAENDCFGFVSEGIDVTIESCCDMEQDVHITTDETFDVPIAIGGDIIIYAGAQLTINTNVELKEGAALIIQNGGKLILDNAHLTTCPLANSWKGIRVRNGGEIQANYSHILNARRGIKAQSGVTLNLGNVEIIGNSGLIGVYLQGAVNLNTFKNMKIEDYFFGIYGAGGAGFYDFDQGEIINTHYGIFLSRSFAYIHEYDINSASRYGVFMSACHGSIVSDCRIGFEDFGISARNTTNLFIDNTSIGYNAQRGRTAVSLLNCQNTNITGDTDVHFRATEFGIRAFQSSVRIKENNIDIQGQTNSAGGGIQLINSLNSRISNNFITTNNAPFGIESVDGQSNSISHNDISVTTAVAKNAAVIRTMGGVSETISDNIIDGNGTIAGIIAQNSTANTYVCNDISNTVNGLAILNNAEGQDIKGNEFLSSIIDLTIQSVIGQQTYTGNEFVNGSARAIGLDEQGIEDSIFFVNGDHTNHMPSNPVPGNGQWFVNDTNEEDYYDECGSSGPYVKFHEDEEKLADYFDKVKLLQNEQPNVFYTKLYDLLKYEQEKVDYTLPNNIKQDAVFANLCGLEELVNMSGQLNDLLGSNNELEGDYQAIRSLQNEYTLTTEAIDRAAILSDLNQSLALLAPAMENQLVADSMTLLNIKNNLENISCTGAYVEKWKDIYTIYIEYIQKGEIAEKGQKALIEYSKECSDQYGDAIHIARALANTFDDTYFDVYDDCLGENKIKLLHPTGNSLNAFIQPNPSKGTVVLHTEDEVTGTIRLIDLTGRVVHTTTMTDAYQHTLNLDLNSGIYYMYLTTSTGAVFVEKIVIAK